MTMLIILNQSDITGSIDRVTNAFSELHLTGPFVFFAENEEQSLNGTISMCHSIGHTEFPVASLLVEESHRRFDYLNNEYPLPLSPTLSLSLFLFLVT